MGPVVAFAGILLVGTLISERAHRSVLSTAVLFLVAGVVLGPEGLGVLPMEQGDDAVALLSELALFSVLFTDGMKVGLRDVADAWRLPTRALGLGLPLTLLLTAILARFLVGLPWLEALLVGAALSPTDPVLAAAIVGRDQIPLRLRRLLNVESGVNDGLVLPVLLVLLAITEQDALTPIEIVAQTAGGVALGIAVPCAAAWLERRTVFGTAERYRPLTGTAIGLLVLGTAQLIGVNEFLAAFAGGVTIATLAPEIRDGFEQLGDLATELLKLAAIFAFGALLGPSLLRAIPVTGYLFAVLAVTAVRPLALALAQLRSVLPRKEWVVAAWFGPKGFASVLYGLLILHSSAPDAPELFGLVGITVALSIVVHSSTDVLVARWFEEQPVEADPGAAGIDAVDPPATG